jgi:hypothetical protein
MNNSFRAAAVSSLIVFTAVGGSTGIAGAATRTACEVMPAAQASGILESAVTTQARPDPVSAGSSLCVYSAGGHPIVQLGLTVMASDASAAEMFKMAQDAHSGRANLAGRRKGNIILSGIAVNHAQAAKLGALLDAAVKNL